MADISSDSLSDDPAERAFQLCKLQAAVDGAFPDALLRVWFASAWDLCAQMVGYEPRQEIVEPICIGEDGNFWLSHRPTSEVRIYDGYTLRAVLSASLRRERCTPALCCLCQPTAHYWIGSEDTCQGSPRFLQAVMRLFAYMCENRGDSELDDQVLRKCGAFAFLQPDLAFVA